ncbi:MAG: type II CAAX prenyl endopeptidase Rce1 family protein [Oscillospiraceae bacterium]
MPSKQTGINDDDRLNWRYQDKTYNEMFKAWRKQRKDTVGFYYVSNPNELTYLDGYGFVTDYPEAAERNALRKVMNIVGITMILLGLIDFFYKYAVPDLLAAFGVDIYFDRYTKVFYGNEWLILFIDTFFGIIKRLIPFMYIYKKLKMPIKVMVPTKVTNKTLFKYAVPSILLAVGVCSAASGIYSEILSSLNIQPEKLFIDMDNNKAVFVIYLIVHIVVIPTISEIHTRGALLQLLRQFGDGIAILFTALLTALISYNINSFCFIFITSTIIGYFTVRTGSVVTAVLMRITVHAFSYGIYIVDEAVSEEIQGLVLMIMLAAAIGVGLVSFVRLLIKHSDCYGLIFKNRYLNFYEKCGIIASSIPVVAGFTLIIIHTIINIKFTI